jgi:hypothetical protein
MKLRILSLLAAFALPAFGNSYSTNFPVSENPISENGNWINGGTVGLDWTNVRTAKGMAVGTQPGNGIGNAQYSDSTAVLAGNWSPNQSAQATISITGATPSPDVYEEVELRLLTTIRPHSITGYEINISVGAHWYVAIVRWNGVLGGFTTLATNNNYKGHNGDVLKATVSNGVITVYLNGVQVLQATDDTYTSGSPGVGFFLAGATGLNANYGVSSFSAADDGSLPTPTPVPTPTPTPTPAPAPKPTPAHRHHATSR